MYRQKSLHLEIRVLTKRRAKECTLIISCILNMASPGSESTPDLLHSSSSSQTDLRQKCTSSGGTSVSNNGTLYRDTDGLDFVFRWTIQNPLEVFKSQAKLDPLKGPISYFQILIFPSLSPAEQPRTINRPKNSADLKQNIYPSVNTLLSKPEVLPSSNN